MSNFSGLYAAVSGSMVQEKRMEALANNLANISTVGYKQDVLSFRSLLTESEKAQGISALVAVSELYTDFSQGNIQPTGNTLDCAISGQGFFEIITPEGPRYTREGRFALNAQNQLVTQNGDPVSGGGGPMTLDGSRIGIGKDGTVTVDEASAGKIKMVGFQDLKELRKVGENLFENIGGPGNQTEDLSSSVHQGFLEFSNVNQMQEMVRMIEISRAYESYQKIIQSMDEAERKLVNDVANL